LKIAVTGKGGVGKTFIASTLARIFEKNNYKVIAVDADPDMNLSCALGIEGEITPISKMEDLIEERTGGKVGSYGGVFKINPKVEDIVDRYSYKVGNIHLLAMGTVEQGGEGCVCPASVLLRRLLRHLILKRDEVVIMDMEAGIEHLGRKTTEHVDVMLVVVEPSKKAILTAKRIKKLAKDLGIPRVYAVVNKIRGDMDREKFRGIFEKEVRIPILKFLPYSEDVIDVDMMGKPLDLNTPIGREMEDLFRRIVEVVHGEK